MVKVSRANPGDFLTAQWPRVGGVRAAEKGVQSHCALRVDMGNQRPCLPNMNRQSDFFKRLPSGALLERFIGQTLAAGKLPQVGQVRVRLAPGDQNTVVMGVPDNGEGDVQARYSERSRRPCASDAPRSSVRRTCGDASA
jgi:hypothetical protein